MLPLPWPLTIYFLTSNLSLNKEETYLSSSFASVVLLVLGLRMFTYSRDVLDLVSFSRGSVGAGVSVVDLEIM